MLGNAPRLGFKLHTQLTVHALEHLHVLSKCPATTRNGIQLKSVLLPLSAGVITAKIVLLAIELSLLLRNNEC